MNNKPIFLYGLGTRKEYRKLFKYFSVPVIDWNKGFIRPALKTPDVLIGFSLGCMLACMHAEKHPVKHLILCSPSPDETLEHVQADHVLFIVGQNEFWVKKEIRRMAKTLHCPWSMEIIPNTGHEMNEAYLKTLLKIFNIRI